MIHPLYNTTIENAIHTDIPDQLYIMMSCLKFRVGRELESKVIDKFNLPLLRNITQHGTPNNVITKITETHIKQFFI